MKNQKMQPIDELNMSNEFSQQAEKAAAATKPDKSIKTNVFIQKLGISRKNWNRACLLVFCIAIIIVGVVLAYLTSHDEVTNKAHSEDNTNIRLLEPAWDETGLKMAEKMQPGVEIPKDPQVLNASENSVYVRMSIVLYDSEGNKITDSDRLYYLLSSIYLYEEDEKSIQLFPKGSLSVDGTISGSYVSNNTNFVYKDGWFYYIDKLSASDTTPSLFDYILIPILKTEYAYFDDGFSIEVEAQAINAESVEVRESGITEEGNLKDESVLTAVVDTFADKYSD